MGQVLRKDKIGSLSHNAGTITLGPSTLTIGGQQYSTSNLNVSADVSVANTRYQIFAIVNSGVVSLVVSSAENSIGPGNASWKLVGSYYTNGITPTAFGSFVTITGKPTTEDIEHFPLINTNSGTLAAGTGGNATQGSHWSRSGSKITFSFSLRFGNSGLGTGNSNYEVILPNAMNRRPTPTGEGGGAFETFGSGALFDVSASQAYGIVFGAGQNTPTDETLMLVEELNSSATVVSSSNPFNFNVDDILRGTFTIEVQEWDNIPIEEL